VVALVPFDTADTAGQPLSRVLTARSFPALVAASEEPKAWLCSTVLVLLVVSCCRVVLRWRTVVLVLVLAVFALLPPLATGHSSSETSHDIATDAIMLHVPAAVVWVGLLAAFVRHSRYAGVPFSRVTARYGRVAGVCWVVVAASGVVDALVLVHPDQLFTSTYGVLVCASAVAMAALAFLGARLRRTVLRTAGDGVPCRRTIVRVASVELVVLLASMGASVALTRLAPPAFLDYRSTVSQQLLGYDLAGSPWFTRLFTDWRIDVIFGPLACVLAVGYVLSVRRLAGAGERWPRARTVLWLVGCLVLLVASSAGIGRYASAEFSVHMLRHMLIGMLVPILLALGGPITLVRRAYPAAADGDLPGFPEWSRMICTGALARFLTHPVVVLVLFSGSPFALYCTGLFDQAVRFHWAHQAIDGYFLLIGYLFAWITVGIDVAPHRLPSLARVGLLLAAMPADVVFAAAVLNTHRIIGNGAGGFNFYQALALPWVSSLSGDQHAAGIVALAVGEVALMVALAALLPRWSPSMDSDEQLSLIDQHRQIPGLAADRT
jgi:putative copper resistance protein D